MLCNHARSADCVLDQQHGFNAWDMMFKVTKSGESGASQVLLQNANARCHGAISTAASLEGTGY